MLFLSPLRQEERFKRFVINNTKNFITETFRIFAACRMAGYVHGFDNWSYPFQITNPCQICIELLL